MGVNTTGRKSLDKLARDPRIVEVWNEGSNGYWASLAPGFNREGCSALHAWTVKDILAQVVDIEVGDPY